MVETNLTKTPDMGEVDAVDFVNQFSYSLAKLQQALGVTRAQPLRQGNAIQTWKFDVTKPSAGAANGTVAEGDDIPLTHVARTKDHLYTVGFKKYRKAVSVEEVQRVGYDLAVTQTDNQVRLAIQKDIRKDFFDYLATAPTDLGKVSGLQEAFGKSWGKLASIFDDEDAGTVVFINPMDAGNYLGDAVISNGSSVGFGMTLLQGFTNVTVVINNSVPEGTFYATVANNINLQYVDVNGESSKLFEGKQVVSDQTGLIALVKDVNTVNLTNQSTIYLGVAMFAEVTNGVLKGTLNPTTVPKV